MKICTSFTDRGAFQFITDLTFLSLIVAPSIPTMYPRNSTDSTWKTYLVTDTTSWCSSSFARTFLTISICSSSLSAYIRILSRQTTTPWSRNSRRILFIIAWNVAGVLTSPNGMTLYSKCPYRVLNGVCHSSPSRILNRWYPSFKSNLVDLLAPATRSFNSPINGRGYLFRIVSLLRLG